MPEGHDGKMDWLRQVNARWRSANLSKVLIGKYIVLFASLLHLVWAGLLFSSEGAGYSTPVAVLLKVFGGEVRAGIVLLAVSVAAMWYPFRQYEVSARAIAATLIPQQIILLISAGGALWAVLQGHYADGVIRPFAFILSDQLPSILLALIYTATVLEAAFNPIKSQHDPEEE